ncbi:hypothetical protein [Patulibacter sp. SYSU D01012]|uniref:hypothetical protein n=1 Tax=Patulibacter sp. SYSU D01012 TaxID=2817381 RepID=UPI001B3017BD|nr:hypothetical protein [Patulibacter sp. SYSU D01012]
MPHRSRTAVAALAAAGVLAVPAAASAAPAATTWAGWDAPGPVGVGDPTHVAAYGATTAVLGTPGADVPLFVSGAAGSRVGRVPLTKPGTPVGLAAAGPDRLLLAEDCRVRRSDDLGATWSGDPLPSCTSGTPVLTTLDARVAWASLPTRTWRTVDGGATWAVVNAAEPGPGLATGEATGFRVVAAGAAGNALQRTTDGGASWQGLKVPGPAPAAEPTADAPAPEAPLVDALPGLTVPALRADGAIVLGAGGAVLISKDGGATFTRHAVPIPDDLPGSGGVVVERVVCEPSGACIVGVLAANDPKRRSALRLDGTTFGARVAALPPSDVTAPAPGVVVGFEGADTTARAVRTDDLGATPYRAIASANDATGSIGVHGLLAVTRVGRLFVSSDHGDSWRDVPLPATPALRRVASAGGSLVALAEDGTLRRFADGAWAPYADVSVVRPEGLAVAGDVPVVVGPRGIIRLTDPAKPEVVSSRALQGRGFSRVVASGKVVVAWGRRNGKQLAVRSADGGRTWSRTKLPAGTDDAQVVGKRVFALAGNTLFRSTDGGKRFAARVTVPDLEGAGPDRDVDADVGLELSSASTGVITTRVGAFVTRDGGKSVAMLPAPGGKTPAVAAVAGSGVVVQDPVLGTVFRNAKLLAGARPKLTLRTVGRPKKGAKGSRTVTIVGVLRGVTGEQEVAVLAVGRKGRTFTQRVVTPNADGSFRVRLRLGRSERGVQAWFGGDVGARESALGVSSRELRVR